MIRLSTLRKVWAAQCAFVCFALHPVGLSFGQHDKEEADVLPLSTAYVPVPGQATGKTFYARVQWEGQEYSAEKGTRVLMRVVTNRATEVSLRAKALHVLGRLRNRDITPQLISLYQELNDRKVKVGVIRCLAWSEDPRGFPFFIRILEHEQDSVLRLSAAAALARWNVRRGVEVLMSLLGSKDRLNSDRTIGYAVANSFRHLNRSKGWGCPEDRIQQEIAARANLSDDDMSALFILEIKKWFTANKHRFPDWKLGDPLPEAPKLPPSPPGPESVLSLSAAFSASPTIWTVGQEKEEEVSWQGKRYPATEGVDLLMKAALEPSGDHDRILSLRRLEYMGSHLRKTERIPQLMKLYGRLTDRPEKVYLLFCLARSKDQRALPLFAEILDRRQEEYLRLPASYGLALWNVRRGVRELIELLSVKQTEKPIRPPGIIADEAAHLLYRLNYWKSWWAPEAALQAAIEARTEVHDEVLDSCHAELKKWFAENEHRFPDWKPGDPLPEVPKSKDNGSAEK